MIAPAKELVDLPLQLREGTCGHRPSRIDDDVPRLSQFREPGTHHFADPPLEAIADNGFAHGSGRGKTDAWARTRVLRFFTGEAESRKERPVMTETVVIHFAEFAGS